MTQSAHIYHNEKPTNQLEDEDAVRYGPGDGMDLIAKHHMHIASHHVTLRERRGKKK